MSGPGHHEERRNVRGVEHDAQPSDDILIIWAQVERILCNLVKHAEDLLCDDHYSTTEWSDVIPAGILRGAFLSTWNGPNCPPPRGSGMATMVSGILDLPEAEARSNDGMHDNARGHGAKGNVAALERDSRTGMRKVDRSRFARPPLNPRFCPPVVLAAAAGGLLQPV